MGISGAVAEALAAIAGEVTVRILLEKLKDHDARVRATAACALGMIADANSIESLFHAIKDENESVGRNALRALKQICHPQAREALKATGIPIGIPGVWEDAFNLYRKGVDFEVQYEPEKYEERCIPDSAIQHYGGGEGLTYSEYVPPRPYVVAKKGNAD